MMERIRIIINNNIFMMKISNTITKLEIKDDNVNMLIFVISVI